MIETPSRSTRNERQRRTRLPGKYIVFALSLITALGAAYFFFTNSDAAYRASKFFAPEAKNSAVGDGRIRLQEFLVDLAPDSLDRSAYLRITLTLAVQPGDEKQAVREIARRKADIRERIMFFLRILTPEDFRGTDRMERLKRELKRRVEIAAPHADISDVLIEDFIIQ